MNSSFFDSFIRLANDFDSHGFSLYLVGGSVRDYLLNIELHDYDFATDATAEEMKTFIKGYDSSFEKFGCLKIEIDSFKFAITTFRKEDEYFDFRHPYKLEFVKDINIDVRRRDFTINGLYMDKEKKIIDLVSGVNDLNKGIIKTIGNPDIRFKEDPLRILRAIRFKLLLDFDLDINTELAIKDNSSLLANLNKNKINEELKKTGISRLKNNIILLKELKVFNYIKDVLE